MSTDEPVNPSTHHNLGAGLASTVPPLLSFGLTHQTTPDVGANMMSFDSPMAKRLMELSKLDIGILRPRMMPGLNGKPGPANAAYVPKPSPLQSAAMGGFSPEELANWRQHGMIVPINMTKPGLSPEALAHELGHATARHGGSIPRAISHLRTPANLLGALGGNIDLLRGMIGDKPLEERDRLFDNASVMLGAGSLPLLADEYNASHNAMRLLRQLPAGEGEAVLARAARMLPRAWAGYGLGALGATLAPQAAKWWYHTHPE